MGRRSQLVAPIAAAQLDVIAKARRVVDVFDVHGARDGVFVGCLADLRLAIDMFDQEWAAAVSSIDVARERA
ncbi:MAG: hypothetical protein WBW04_20255 [Nitrolancea sp.]